jgi:hypothetical protein
MIHLPPLHHDRPHLVTWGLTATAAGGLAIFTAMRRASSRVIRVATGPTLAALASATSGLFMWFPQLADADRRRRMNGRVRSPELQPMKSYPSTKLTSKINFWKQSILPNFNLSINHREF